MSSQMDRREFLKTTGAVVAAGTAAAAGLASSTLAAPIAAAGENAGRIYKALKFGMVAIRAPLGERFQFAKDAGFDGVDMDSPGKNNIDEIRKAVDKTGLRVHGVVDSTHWNIRLSSPDEKTRAQAVADLKTAIRDSHAMGGSSVLLVPGAARDKDKENAEHIYERAQIEVRKALPLATELGVHILIENVWNGFYLENVEKFRQFIDDFNSPWVGVYFDIGNIRKYAKSEDWIKALGKRIVKLDIKDWGKANGFGHKIGDGDVDWAAVRAELKKIEFTGWATAEVGGGGPEELADIARRMDKVLDIGKSDKSA